MDFELGRSARGGLGRAGLCKVIARVRGDFECNRLFASVISLDVLMFWVNSSDGVLWQRTMICASSSVS